MAEFASFDGTRLAYQMWPGGGRPVLLLHGYIADASLNWVGPGIVGAFTQAGRTVIAPDARGHGTSEKPHDPARYGEEIMVRDVCALMDHLGLSEVDLIGYSMGAVVALLTTLRDARVRRLIVGGVGSGVVEVGGLDSRVVAPADLASALLAAEAPDPQSQLGAFRFFADFVGADREALAAAASAKHPEFIAVSEIAVPAMVIAGDADPLAARPHVLADSIPGAKLVVLPGDHLSVLRDPGFIPALVAFVPQP
jgi:pimeloyl-ACP methyl ester carboxylesterase